MAYEEKDQNIDPGFKGFRSGPKIIPLAEKKKNRFGYEYAEHAFIGDHTTLSGLPKGSSPYQFKLPSGLSLTYGQINALAGDFYGTNNPISDGVDLQDQQARFVAAYNLLAQPSSWIQKDASSILQILQQEVDAVNKAVAEGIDPSVVYASLPDESIPLNNITLSRPYGVPGYFTLASINWDHFGYDAYTAYIAGHTAALLVAASGDLERAYTMNAFADHFVGDMFAAGHMRTPRRYLHSPTNKTYDLLAKAMHDEDNAIGLDCVNKIGWTWRAYGDKRLLDKVNAMNAHYLATAVQVSANEIYVAYSQKKIPAPTDFNVWGFTPDLNKLRNSTQELAPLFWPSDGSMRRTNIENRRTYQYTTNWWAVTTWTEIQTDGWWTYPITIDGPQRSVLDHPAMIKQLKQLEELKEAAHGEKATNGISNGTVQVAA